MIHQSIVIIITDYSEIGGEPGLTIAFWLIQLFLYCAKLFSVFCMAFKFPEVIIVIIFRHYHLTYAYSTISDDGIL